MEQKANDPEIKHIWLRDPEKQPLACFAWRPLNQDIEADQPEPIRWGVSVWHQGLTWSEKGRALNVYGIEMSADQFNRQLGREIAVGRMNSDKGHTSASVFDAMLDIFKGSEEWPLRVRVSAALLAIKISAAQLKEGQKPLELEARPS